LHDDWNAGSVLDRPGGAFDIGFHLLAPDYLRQAGEATSSDRIGPTNTTEIEALPTKARDFQIGYSFAPKMYRTVENYIRESGLLDGSYSSRPLFEEEWHVRRDAAIPNLLNPLRGLQPALALHPSHLQEEEFLKIAWISSYTSATAFSYENRICDPHSKPSVEERAYRQLYLGRWRSSSLRPSSRFSS
jgi:hypothetical protein